MHVFWHSACCHSATGLTACDVWRQLQQALRVQLLRVQPLRVKLLCVKMLCASKPRLGLIIVLTYGLLVHVFWHSARHAGLTVSDVLVLIGLCDCVRGEG